MPVRYLIILITSAFIGNAFAQGPVGASTSERANEVATNTQKQALNYDNQSIQGPSVVVLPGEMKSTNASFKQKITANNIADYGELELFRANFKVTKNQKTAKYIVKFDVLKAEKVAKASSSFSGSTVNNMLGGLGGSALKSLKTDDKSEVWIVGMRYQLLDPKTGDMVGTGYAEDTMELGSKATSMMGVTDKASGGATLDTLVQYLVQKNIVEMDQKYKMQK